MFQPLLEVKSIWVLEDTEFGTERSDGAETVRMERDRDQGKLPLCVCVCIHWSCVRFNQTDEQSSKKKLLFSHYIVFSLQRDDEVESLIYTLVLLGDGFLCLQIYTHLHSILWLRLVAGKIFETGLLTTYIYREKFLDKKPKNQLRSISRIFG